MRQCPDEDHRECHAGCCQQPDREQATSQLGQVQGQSRLENKPRYEGQEYHVGADVAQSPARQQSDDHACRGQHHRVRQQSRALRHQAQHGGQRADQDQEQQKALLRAHSSTDMPSRAALTSTPSRCVRPAASSQGCARQTVIP